MMARHPQFTATVQHWFDDAFGTATPCQAAAWESIGQGHNTLVAAPTGSGKTLAAFLVALDRLVTQASREPLDDAVEVLYVSPLKALSNDINKNLEVPLAGITAASDALGRPRPNIRTAVRTGDTPQAARAQMRKRPPHILVTTPESLYVLLTSDGGREMLAHVKTVIVDEIHAVAGNKRGAHLSLSLARLQALVPHKLLKIGLSATQRPIERIADFLCCGEHCQIINEGHARDRDVAIEIPPSPLEPVMAGEVSAEIYDRIAELIDQHHTTLVFVNTRRLAERIARALAERVGEQWVCSHHGSMSKERRLLAEQRLKKGELKALVATASLELGIDIGDVDLVCQLGATRTVAMLLQRIGRSGHALDRTPKGRLFPQTPDDLVECLALLSMIKRDELDELIVPPGPLDVLAQQLVAEVASGEWRLDDLYALAKSTAPYRDLNRAHFEQVLDMLSDGFSLAHGRRSAYLHVDRVNGLARARKGARLTAVTCGGAIPDNADYDVVAEPRGEFVGTVNEDFAIESLPGNIFQLGNTSWRVLKVESNGLRVEDAAGEPPNMPFWFGEAPARSRELSVTVSELRKAVARVADDGASMDEVNKAIMDFAPGCPLDGARQAADYLVAGYRALEAMPTQDTIVLERFFDDSGGMQLVLHSPFGSRVNKAWGLALRKRFCRTFNFELQAAAIEDAIVISLGAVHSFALEDVWRFLQSTSVREVLTQALLDVPMFTIRWRWVASCALAMQRFRSGKKVPARLQRMHAEDLIALIFPDQLACAENLSGKREVPEHPLVFQAVEDCLSDAMDIEGLEKLLKAIESDEKTLVCRDVTEPSPFAMGVLNANFYAFLDDAPLEERRTQAVNSRRWLDPKTASDLGQLDQAAIARVQSEIWPAPRDSDELHEAIVMLGFVTAGDLRALAQHESFEGLERWRDALQAAGRCKEFLLQGDSHWVATEREEEAFSFCDHLNDKKTERAVERLPFEDALMRLMRSRAELVLPITLSSLKDVFRISEQTALAQLAALEQQGILLRGKFDSEIDETQWCDRTLLARVHRYTIKRLRQEIEPVDAACYQRFLFAWQGLSGDKVAGPEGLAARLEALAGFETAAGAWDAELLGARLTDYREDYLDTLVASGRFTWLRLSPKQRAAKSAGSSPLKSTPMTLVPRRELGDWTATSNWQAPASVSTSATIVWELLNKQGAMFFDDLAQDAHMPPTQCEAALSELAGAGLITSDSFTGLRALVRPQRLRSGYGARRRNALPGLDSAGRWDLVRNRKLGTSKDSSLDEDAIETLALNLLRRYGVLFRKLIDRESHLPPWRHLVWALRRLEAAGRVRGGRFVAAATGEQFALPDALGLLRKYRATNEQLLVVVAACDPCNLTSILTPGVRVPAVVGNRIAYIDGEPVGARVSAEVTFYGEGGRKLDHANEVRVRTALIKQSRSSRSRTTRAPLRFGA
ncbi:MAG: DEAD/DEAH box helicase [Pseudomonadota bacterium]